MNDIQWWVAQAGDDLGVSEVGGKAQGLDRLLALGLPVPRFLVLTTHAYRSCCTDGVVPDDEDRSLAGVLDRVWADLGSGSVPLAVRSSAVEEDGEARSWAGQMETHLNVTTREGLGRAVLGCWRSLHGDRARAYRKLTDAGEPAGNAAIAVIVQEMVQPASSGVMFTRDPVSTDRNRMIVSAVLGLGEGLVSGTLDADTFTLDRAGEVVERNVVRKTERVVAGRCGGTTSVHVPERQSSAPSIDDRTLRALARHAVEAEHAAGVPLDIEFAVDRRGLWFLQARPITTVLAADSGERLVWDNSNIVESYPGITLPLTFSFIRRAYHAVYWQFCQLLGMKDEEIRTQDHMLHNMLGLHDGRVYYNLRNWYRLVSVLPGFRHNRRFMEGMMGVEEQGGDESDRLSRSRGMASLVGTAARAAWLQLTLDGRVKRFQATFHRVHAEFDALPYETMEPSEVLDAYRRVERALLWRWRAPIVNDFSVMVFYGLLKRLTVRWGVDDAGHLQNALVAHQGGVESTEVSHGLEALADAIRGDAALCHEVLQGSPEEAFARILAHGEHGPMLAAYMQRFGDRCVAELKLESRTLHDDPAPLIGALRTSLRRDLAGGAYHRPDATRAAEEAVRRSLSPWRRVVYRRVLSRARAGIKNRENQRLARTRAFALVRRMMRSIGRSFAAQGLLDDWEDVFFLELDELMGLCDGTATLADPRPLVEARRAEFQRFGLAPPLPDRFVTRGTAVTSARIEEKADGAPSDEEGALTGQTAYPGVVERRAVVMPELDPEQRLQGEILVTRQTDPGWVILFPSIGGLVVERGSMLSHSAIVAREMGIPAVVGVRGATDAIVTGDRIRLDGATGVVRVLERVEPES